MGSLAQAVEHLLYKHEALNSNPSPTKKKKEERNHLMDKAEKINKL
jgi:hypothetical protein